MGEGGKNTMIDTQLKDKVVLITGANHGIGAAAARAFAAEAARVAIHFLDASPPDKFDGAYAALHVVKGRAAAAEIVRQIQVSGGRAIAVPGDLADPATAPALFDAVEAAYGPVEVLVNNAVHCEDPDTIFTTSAGSLDRYCAVNIRGTVLLMREFVRRYQQRGGRWGRVINLSTDAAQRFAGQIGYGGTKAAIEAFTRSIAIEVGPLGITVNAVAPGPVQTGWMKPELEARLAEAIPLRRVGQPEDIAEAIVFLASEQARWLTGQVIKVSGGHEI
jgi:3-oxoacyl-[acyl-carrier protein] reductase